MESVCKGEAELAVLGAILIEPSSYWGMDILPDYFVSEQNRIILKGIGELMEQDKTVDIVSLTGYLKGRGLLQKAGGTSRLQECLSECGSSAMLHVYIRMIRENYLNRRLAQVGREMVETAKDEAQKPDEKIQDFIKRLEDALKAIPQALVTVDQGLKQEFSELEKEFRGEVKPGILTGFRKLDNILGGLGPGDLITGAGQTSIGKTALALSIVRNCWKSGHRVGFISLEMSRGKIIRRLLAMESKVNLHYLKQQSMKSLGGEFWGPLTKAVNDLSGSVQTSYVETLIRNRTARAIYNLAAQMKRENNIELLIVDHLHRMVGGKGSKYETTTDNVQAVKSIAQDLEIPVILTAQVNRKLEKNEEPQLYHLRDSGAIEEASDAVAFLTRREDEKKAWLWILKNREGPANRKIPLKWISDLTLFMDWNE